LLGTIFSGRLENSFIKLPPVSSAAGGEDHFLPILLINVGQRCLGSANGPPDAKANRTWQFFHHLKICIVLFREEIAHNKIPETKMELIKI
jgi:hypothetical protein